MQNLTLSGTTAPLVTIGPIQIGADVIRRALPEDVIQACGGTDKLLQLPIGEYFFYETQKARTRQRDENLLANPRLERNWIWLEIGRSEDLNESDINFPAPAGRPMIAIAIMQKMTASKTGRYWGSINEIFTKKTQSYLNTLDFPKNETREIDVVFRYCFTETHEEETHIGVLLKAHFYNQPADAYESITNTSEGYYINDFDHAQVLIDRVIDESNREAIDYGDAFVKNSKSDCCQSMIDFFTSLGKMIWEGLVSIWQSIRHCCNN